MDLSHYSISISYNHWVGEIPHAQTLMNKSKAACRVPTSPHLSQNFDTPQLLNLLPHIIIQIQNTPVNQLHNRNSRGEFRHRRNPVERVELKRLRAGNVETVSPGGAAVDCFA